MSERIHIYPVSGRHSDHRTDKSEICWCDPEVKQVCPESDDNGKCEDDCWRCKGSGLVDPYDEELNYLIIHKPGQLGDALKELVKK